VQISHSGTVAGILFDAGSIGGSDDALVEDVTARVRSLGVRPRGVFISGAED
jgi:uncharacterized protein involved in propanediol utilization